MYKKRACTLPPSEPGVNSSSARLSSAWTWAWVFDTWAALIPSCCSCGVFATHSILSMFHEIIHSITEITLGARCNSISILQMRKLRHPEAKWFALLWKTGNAAKRQAEPWAHSVQNTVFGSSLSSTQVLIHVFPRLGRWDKLLELSFENKICFHVRNLVSFFFTKSSSTSRTICWTNFTSWWPLISAGA